MLRMGCVFLVFQAQHCSKKKRSCASTLIIKPTRCTNFSNLFLEQNSVCFRQVFCPSSGVQYCIHSNRCCLLAESGSCQQAVSKTCMTYTYCCVYSTRHLMMDRKPVRNVEFYSKNKFEKLMHLVGFIIRIYHDTWSSECQTVHQHMPLLGYEQTTTCPEHQICRKANMHSQLCCAFICKHTMKYIVPFTTC